MQSDTKHSTDNGAKEATESSQLATSSSAPNRLARRSFLRNLGLGAALLMPGAALLSGSGKALAGPLQSETIPLALQALPVIFRFASTSLRSRRTRHRILFARWHGNSVEQTQFGLPAPFRMRLTTFGGMARPAV